MTPRHSSRLFAVCLSVSLTACSSGPPIETEPRLATFGRSAFQSGPIELPANYREADYRRLIMAVAFMEQGARPGEISNEIIQTVSTRLQTEMQKLRRFTIFSLHNRGGVRLVEELHQYGEANVHLPKGEALPPLDLVLTGSLTMSKERQSRYSHDELVYEVECDVSAEDLKTRTVRFAEKAKGRALRTQAVSLSGRQLGGIQEDDERQALFEAAMKALLVLANKLGNTFPIGGRVTGILGDRLTLDKGFDSGIAGKTQMVVYTKVQGVDLPMAMAEAHPGAEATNLTVWRWNTDDPDAKRAIDALRQSPDWLGTHELWAVSAGMPLPPEWEGF